MNAITEQQAAQWRPEIPGWSDDILPYYDGLDLPTGARVVEVGVAYGRSLTYLAERLDQLGRHDVELWAVDAWRGEAEFAKVLWTLQHVSAARRMVNVVRCEGVRAAALFPDASLDLVFEDSDHSLEGMRRAIAAWLPKVRPGGRYAGHDYQAQDWPGVVQAVDEAFGDRAAHPTRTVWEVRP